MANTRGPLNSVDPSTGFVVSGVFNTQAPAPADQQACALQVDSEGNLLVNVAVGGGGGSSTVKIQDSSGNALNSDGFGALQVAVVSGGGSNDSVGLTGAAAPASATEIGIIDGTGKLQGASSTNPVPVTGIVAVTQSTSPWVVSLTSTTITGTVAVTQSTSPWVVSLASTTITGTVAVTQSTSPWVISFTAPQHVIVDSGSIGISGTVGVTQSTSPWVVSLTSTTITGTVAVTQSTSPWIVAGGGTAGTAASGVVTVQGIASMTPLLVTATFSSPQHVIVDSGTIAVTQSTSPWVVSLASTTITGTVAVTQSTSPWVISFTAPQHVIVDSGTIAVTQSTSPWVVSLSSTTITGTVAVTQSTSPWVASSGVVAVNSQTWTSGNAGTSASIVVTGYDVAIVTFNGSGTITTGSAVFEVSDDSGTTWFPIYGVLNNVIDAMQPTLLVLTTGLASYRFNVSGYTNFRVRNSVTITGSGGQVIVRAQASNAYSPNLAGKHTVIGDLITGISVPSTSPSIGALVAQAAVAPSAVAEGTASLLSVDLSNNLRVIFPSAQQVTFPSAQHVIVDSGVITSVTSITNALPAGSNIIGKVDVLGNAGATLDAAINTTAPTNALWHTNAPATASAAALTPIAITSTAQKVLKASPGNLYGLTLVSLNVTTTSAGVLYVHFFNTTTTTTLSTTSWIGSLPIVAPSSASTSATLSIPPGALALMNFSVGIVIVVSTTSTSNTTAGGTGVVGTFFIE